MPSSPDRNASREHCCQDPHEKSKTNDDIPACQSCRKRKARCNRAQPCSQCKRFNADCVYDDRRMKPGVRAGAVDQLHRRLETLENMFLGQEMIWKSVWQALYPKSALLVPSDQAADTRDLEAQRERLERFLLHVASQTTRVDGQSTTPEETLDEEEEPRKEKRRRIEGIAPTPAPALSILPIDIDGDITALLPAEVMDELIDFYYVNIHPWIPVLHIGRFRDRMKWTNKRRCITCILHAIIAVCARFSRSAFLQDEMMKSRIAEKSRQKVILDATENFSVENLQALVIIAFDTIGRGRGPSSWSIVGSMVATVEQLQLSIEEDLLYDATKPGENLIRRMVFLSPSSSWSEAEERRRVFWTVLLMDRFCSVSTGWKVSLASADVKRRLPCEGGLWATEKEIQAPYFGSAGSMDTSLTGAGVDGRQNQEKDGDQDAIGGFAYNIEATESLALVTDFFLHRAFIVGDAQKVRTWLLEFKHLDLRLIQWKLDLPQKWREASVLNSDGVMDPNLTLAHITHNTAVILLHQAIAYPPAHWRSCPVKLPSASSAETCLEAASEIATIGQQFMSFSPIFTNPQFSFCLFIAGRMLLAHARHNRVVVPPAIDTLIPVLLEISRRWSGYGEGAGSCSDNLALSFANRLVEARDKAMDSPRSSLDIRQTAYSEESKAPTQQLTSLGMESSAAPLFSPSTVDAVSRARNMSVYSGETSLNSFDAITLAFPPLPSAFQQSFTGIPGSNSYSPRVQVTEDQASLPVSIEASGYPACAMWQGPAPYSNGAPNPQQDWSHLFNLASPDRRISRYGGLQGEDTGNDGTEENINKGAHCA